LKQVWLAETLHGEGTLWVHASTAKQNRGDLLEYVECDVAEALGRCSLEGDFLTERHQNNILVYMKMNRSDGQAYFRQLVETFKFRLIEEWGVVIEEGEPLPVTLGNSQCQNCADHDKKECCKNSFQEEYILGTSSLAEEERIEAA